MDANLSHPLRVVKPYLRERFYNMRNERVFIIRKTGISSLKPNRATAEGVSRT